MGVFWWIRSHSGHRHLCHLIDNDCSVDGKRQLSKVKCMLFLFRSKFKSSLVLYFSILTNYEDGDLSKNLSKLSYAIKHYSNCSLTGSIHLYKTFTHLSPEMTWNSFTLEQRTAGYCISELVCQFYHLFFLENHPVPDLKVWLAPPFTDLSLPQGKQEVAEMCFLLECETASLAKAQAGTAPGLKATGRSGVSLILYIILHITAS